MNAAPTIETNGFSQIPSLAEWIQARPGLFDSEGHSVSTVGSVAASLRAEEVRSLWLLRDPGSVRQEAGKASLGSVV